MTQEEIANHRSKAADALEAEAKRIRSGASNGIVLVSVDDDGHSAIHHWTPLIGPFNQFIDTLHAAFFGVLHKLAIAQDPHYHDKEEEKGYTVN